jgi:hypothetical protein
MSVRLHDGDTMEVVDFGKKLVGKRLVSIEISPEELLEYWKYWGEKKTLSYLTSLTKQYKRND